jgi:LPXTG-motif cell wall-anchored protein
MDTGTKILVALFIGVPLLTLAAGFLLGRRK